MRPLKPPKSIKQVSRYLNHIIHLFYRSTLITLSAPIRHCNEIKGGRHPLSATDPCSWECRLTMVGVPKRVSPGLMRSPKGRRSKKTEKHVDFVRGARKGPIQHLPLLMHYGRQHGTKVRYSLRLSWNPKTTN